MINISNQVVECRSSVVIFIIKWCYFFGRFLLALVILGTNFLFRSLAFFSRNSISRGISIFEFESGSEIRVRVGNKSPGRNVAFRSIRTIDNCGLDKNVSFNIVLIQLSVVN